MSLLHSPLRPGIEPSTLLEMSMKKKQTTSITGLGLLCLLLTMTPRSGAQIVTALPKLDLNHFTGSWYEIARIPNKRQKECVSDAFTQIALADKPNRFQLVNACRTKTGDMDANNGNGKTQDKKIADGRLKVTFLWPFYQKFWVLALDPNEEWALVGSPNRKTLWIFSKTRTMAPETLTSIEAQATAQGFPTAKLVMTEQHRPSRP
jgi:apolipoprotein D and lipocalin family protein